MAACSVMAADIIIYFSICRHRPKSSTSYRELPHLPDLPSVDYRLVYLLLPSWWRLTLRKHAAVSAVEKTEHEHAVVCSCLQGNCVR